MTDPSYADVTERMFRTFHAVHPIRGTPSPRRAAAVTGCLPGLLKPDDHIASGIVDPIQDAVGDAEDSAG